MKKSVFILSLATLFVASCSDDDNKGGNVTPPVSEAVVEATVGGPNQPNQVYIDLSTSAQTSIQRDSWDLGFATGSDFRVIINGSIKMAVKQLETTNIDEVQNSDSSVAVGYSTDATWGYVDNPTGVLTGNGGGEGTAIAAISATESDNKVYLVNLGFEVATTPPASGVALDGDARGWKKIRITRNGNGYTLQYADLDSTTHQTVNISKNADFNFTFFSLTAGQTVNVQPEKDKWDLNFTGFTNYYPFGSGSITYFFADFITTNIHGGTKAYMVLSSEEDRDNDYAAFTIDSVVETDFTASSSDQRILGDTWRTSGGPAGGPTIRNDRFYVVKDAAGNVYKLKFLALSRDGVRGYPVFEYELL